tara:strand:+ start:494 stop:787 length:294 start_codon:yes stop_codon:yes gene_type:complete
MFDDKYEKDALMDEAYKVYSQILSSAIRDGYIDDPFKMVSLFLGLNIAENIMYQKLLDSGCTIESVELSKKKITDISQKIISQVKGKMMIPDQDGDI